MPTCVSSRRNDVHCGGRRLNTIQGHESNKNLVRYSIGSVQYLCRENGLYAHPLPIPERITYVLYCLSLSYSDGFPKPHPWRSNNQPLLACFLLSPVASSTVFFNSQRNNINFSWTASRHLQLRSPQERMRLIISYLRFLNLGHVLAEQGRYHQGLIILYVLAL
jgi:hypothetical protein